MKYKIAVFYVLRREGEHKYHYHIITWGTEKPWPTYETVLYYHPRKRLSHHYILHLPGELHCSYYSSAAPVFDESVLETRTNVKKAIKLVEYERTI